PRLEDEAPPPVHLLEDRVARDVAGEEVRSELDAAVGEPERLRESLHELRLAEPRKALEEEMAAGDDARDDVVHQLHLAEEDAVQGRSQRAERTLGGGDTGLARVIHHVLT